MKRSLLGTVAVLAGLVLLPASAPAQEEEPASGYYVYGTYSNCDLGDQWLADQIVENHYVGPYDAAVEAGTIGGWGYMAHHTGGPWRRVIFHVAPTIDALMAAQESVGNAIDEASPEAGPSYARLCSSHDDYVWHFVDGSSPDIEQEERGKVGFSVYYVCNEAEESRADEIVDETLAAIYDRHVEQGKLSSWGWLEHWIGGKYRRLATTTAADLKTLLASRDAIIRELIDSHSEAMEEFTSICSSHQDYIWEVVAGTP